jgi:hypothetical protein
VRYEVVLHTVNEERNILRVIKGRKANWTGHTWRRNYPLQHVIEEEIEGRLQVRGRRGRRRKQLLDDRRRKRSYWKLKYESVDCAVWRTRFGRG